MTVQGGTEYNTLRRSVHNSQARQIVGALTATHNSHRLAEGCRPYNPAQKNKRRDLNRMENNKRRDLYLKIRVNQEELDYIDRKFRESGMKSRSDFVRAMIYQGYIV